MQEMEDVSPIRARNLSPIGNVRRRWTRELWQYLVLLLPALILYVVFTLYPILSGVRVASTNMRTVGGSYEYVGLANFADILFSGRSISEDFYNAFRWTAVYWFGNWVIGVLVLGFGAALILYENIKFRNSFLIVIFMPYVVSNLALGYLLRLMLDPNSGAVNLLLQSLHITSKPITFLAEGWPANVILILVTAWKFIGFNAAIFLAGLVAVPEETIEAAKIDGANYSQTLFRVMVPQMWPTIITASILCFTGTWKLFALPVALAGNTLGSVESLDVLAVVFYRWAFSRVGFGHAAALMAIVAFILMIGSAFQVNLIRRGTVEY